MAFWIAPPLMDSETFILMAATLGASLAVAKTLAAMAVFALVRWPVFVLYLALGLVGSLLSGYGYQAALAL